MQGMFEETQLSAREVYVGPGYYHVTDPPLLSD